MSLEGKDLPLLDQTIDRLSLVLNESEKDYAKQVCNTIFSEVVPNETWVSSTSYVRFVRIFKVSHHVTSINANLIKYINCIVCKQFATNLNKEIKFQFDIDFIGTEDDTPTDEIPPMYWGENLMDKFQLTIRIKKY